MLRSRRVLTGILSATTMVLLILDSKTALIGAKDGISLCLYTIIPSLFPFFVVSGMISNQQIGKRIPLLRPLGKLCGIPAGGESILLLGFMGGYPVGAQVIYDGYTNGQLNRNTARRLLGFCNNAGPAFIFGILSPLFSSAADPWLIWLVHILSAIIVGIVLPDRTQEECNLNEAAPVTLTGALENSLKVTANVCGWIIIFRVILSFLRRWVLWFVPTEVQVALIGILELSNGCIELSGISSESVRFILCCGMLSFGGLCVGIQTAAVTRELSTGMYFPGKLLQSMVSILLAVLIQQLKAPQAIQAEIMYVCIACFCGAALTFILLRHRKKSSSITDSIIV